MKIVVKIVAVGNVAVIVAGNVAVIVAGNVAVIVVKFFNSIIILILL